MNNFDKSVAASEEMDKLSVQESCVEELVADMSIESKKPNIDSTSVSIESETDKVVFIPNNPPPQINNSQSMNEDGTPIATSSTVQRVVEMPTTMVLNQEMRNDTTNRPTHIPAEYYCQPDRDAIMNREAEPVPVTYNRNRQSKRYLRQQ